MHAVYVRPAGGAVFFSTRAEFLYRLPGRVAMDSEAWATTLVLGAPVGSATPSAEIRRLGPGQALSFDATARSRWVFSAPDWLGDGDRGGDAGALADAVRSALPTTESQRRPPAIPVSGGWDSRLLAALAAKSYTRRPRAWTTEQDDGRNLDMAFAPAVVKTLGLRHKKVRQPRSGWPDLARETRERVQYETWLHQWLTPLARRMRHRERAILDGLAGDVLIKGLFVDDELLAGDHDDQVEGLFQRLGGRDDRFRGRLADRVVDSLIGTSRSVFRRVAREFSGHRNHLALAVLHTRTARAIAPSPLGVFAPEMKPWLPFLHPAVVSQALRIDPAAKTDGTLYKAVLDAAAPAVARLPSTNDTHLSLPRRGPRLQEGPEAIAWMVNDILSSEAALILLDDGFRSELESHGTPRRLDYHTVRLLQGLSLLAQWERVHREQLREHTLRF